MPPSSRRRKARPERIRVALTDDASGSIPLPLPSRRAWPVGLVFLVFFAIFTAVAVGQIASMRGREVEDVFGLAFLLFQGFWVLGWSVAVLVLFLLTVLFLFYGESARITGGRLVHVPRLGPFKILVEYDLAKIRNLRADPSKAGGARIRFDYGDGQSGLGNQMPPAEAEARIQTIRSAIDTLGLPAAVAEPVAPVATPAVTQRPPAPAPSPRSLSALALLGASLVPLGGVLFFGWSLGEVMVLFWAESAIIGFYNLLKLAVVGKWAAVFLGPFFLGHYGGFMAAHFLFVYVLFVRGLDAAVPEPGLQPALAQLFVPLWPALLAMTMSHGISFVTNFLGHREYRGRRVQEQMAEPYKRIVVMHLTIIAGGWFILLLGSPLPALILLIVLKTGLDLRAHRREHGASPATPAALTAQPG